MDDRELALIRAHYAGHFDYVPVHSGLAAIRRLVSEIDRLKGTPLPEVPPLKSCHQCRICCRRLEGEWSAASPEQKVELERQMRVGRCDYCTRLTGEESLRG